MDESPNGSRYPVVECLIPLDDLEWASAELYDLGTVGIEELDPSALSSPRGLDSQPSDSDPIGSNRRTEETEPKLRTGSSGLLGIRAGFPSEVMALTAAKFLLEGEADRAVPWQPRVEIIVGDDWLDTWREHFSPLRTGRIVVAPAWKQHDGSLSEDRVLNTVSAHDIVLWLEPGRAWGTGAHTSTALCLSALQLELNPAASESGARKTVLDVGCGSGVLTVAALLLGASSAYGIDIDESSPGVTLENASRNGVRTHCEASVEPVGRVTGTYSVVLANILAPVLIDLADEISGRVSPGGVLILAGLIEQQRERVLAAYPDFVLERTEYQGEWVGLTLRPRLVSLDVPRAKH